MEPWDYVPADDATDEEWDAALKDHLHKLKARKEAGGKTGRLRQIEEEWKSLPNDPC